MMRSDSDNTYNSNNNMTTRSTTTKLWHRNASGAAAAAAASAATATTGSLSSSRQQSSLPQQQQQQAQSPSHGSNSSSSSLDKSNRSISNTGGRRQRSLSTWLLSSVFRLEKMHYLLLLLMILMGTVWITNFIVFVWPSTSSVNRTRSHAASSSSQLSPSSLFLSTISSNTPPTTTQQQRVVEMMIRLDDLSNRGGLPPPLRNHRLGKKPYFGVEHLQIMQDDYLPRRLFHHPDEHYEDYMKPGEGDDEVDWYYLVDDDVKRNPYVLWEDQTLQDEKSCRRVAWQQDMYLNCNTFHEFDFQTLVLNQKSKHVGAGAYRDVFMAETELDRLVLKESSYEHSHSRYNYEDYHYVRKDGIIAAQLQPHPLLVDTYGWCQLSLFGELMPAGDVLSAAVPRYERCNQTYASMDIEKRLIPMNDLSPTRKLSYALQMAESIAVLNNFKGGVIVHDDVQLPQWLMVEGDRHKLKLNDFNRMEPMYFDEENKEYCMYKNNPGMGDWRAPEEYFDKPLDEKIDVWSLGNNFYSLLTGIYPFHDECRSKYVQKRVKAGEKAYINPKWAERSYAESVLVDVIEHCWEFKATDRPNIGQLVRRLRDAVNENKKLRREYMQKQKQKEQAQEK